MRALEGLYLVWYSFFEAVAWPCFSAVTDSYSSMLNTCARDVHATSKIYGEYG